MSARNGCLAALVAVVLGLLGAPAAIAAPADFYGLEAKDIFAFKQSYRDGELPKVQAAGVGLMRQEFSWRTIETLPGIYSWGKYDTFVRDAAKRGIEVMPVLIGVPAFRSSNPTGSEMSPPLNYGDLGDFAAVVSARYGPNGSYWAANPTIPKVPVRRFQIWNEPNIPRFWPAGVNPAQYAAMLKAVYPKIKAADPGAEVVSAGISEPQNVCCMPLREFITKMYQAGAKGSFDTLAIHPYWANAAGSITLVEATRKIMADFGDSAHAVRISEIGWSTGGTPYIYNQTEAGQAAQLRTLYSELARRRTELNVKGIVWSIWSDQPSSQDWAQYTGLERADLSPKPAYEAYREVSADAGAPSPPPSPGISASGVPLGASISVARTVKLRRLLRGLRIKVSCPSRCRVDLRLALSAKAAKHPRSRRSLLARVKRKLKAGRTTVLLKPNRRARRRLRNIRRLRVFLRARIVPQSPARPATIARRITVTR